MLPLLQLACGTDRLEVSDGMAKTTIDGWRLIVSLPESDSDVVTLMVPIAGGQLTPELLKWALVENCSISLAHLSVRREADSNANYDFGFVSSEFCGKACDLDEHAIRAVISCCLSNASVYSDVLEGGFNCNSLRTAVGTAAAPPPSEGIRVHVDYSADALLSLLPPDTFYPLIENPGSLYAILEGTLVSVSPSRLSNAIGLRIEAVGATDVRLDEAHYPDVWSYALDASHPIYVHHEPAEPDRCAVLVGATIIYSGSGPATTDVIVSNVLRVVEIAKAIGERSIRWGGGTHLKVGYCPPSRVWTESSTSLLRVPAAIEGEKLKHTDSPSGLLKWIQEPSNRSTMTAEALGYISHLAVSNLERQIQSGTPPGDVALDWYPLAYNTLFWCRDQLAHLRNSPRYPLYFLEARMNWCIEARKTLQSSVNTAAEAPLRRRWFRR